MNSLLAMLCAFSEVFLLWFLVALIREYRKVAGRRRLGKTRASRRAVTMWIESMNADASGAPRKPPQTAALVLMGALLALSGAMLFKF